MDMNRNKKVEARDSVSGKILARNLISKVVVGKAGKKFGEMHDLIFDTVTGEIIDFTIKNPTSYVKNITLERDSEGDFLIPFHSVNAIGDFVVISEEEIL